MEAKQTQQKGKKDLSLWREKGKADWAKEYVLSAPEEDKGRSSLDKTQ